MDSHQSEVLCGGETDDFDNNGGWVDLFVYLLNRGIDTVGITDFTAGNGATIATKHLTASYAPQNFQDDTTVEVIHTPQ